MSVEQRIGPPRTAGWPVSCRQRSRPDARSASLRHDGQTRMAGFAVQWSIPTTRSPTRPWRRWRKNATTTKCLGVERNATEGQISEAYRKLAHEVSSRPQSGRRRGRRQVQGSGRGLRGAQPPREAGPLRPLRPRRAGRRRRAAVPRRRRHLRGLRRHLRRGLLRRHLRRRRGRGARSARAPTSAAKSTLDLFEAAHGHGEGRPLHAARSAAKPAAARAPSRARKPETCRYCGGQRPRGAVDAASSRCKPPALPATAAAR